MSSTFVRTLALLLVCGSVAAAQRAESAQPPAQNKAAAPPPNEIAQPRAPAPSGQPVNIKLDLTISDQNGPGAASNRVVTLLVADRSSGSIRSMGHVDKQGPVKINVDARPHILGNGAILLGLGLEYAPRAVTTDQNGGVLTSLNEAINVVLEPGKPLIVSQAADAASDRKITVEVRAVILK